MDACDQPAKGGFPGSRRPHHGQALAAPQGQVDAVQHVMIRAVGVGHVRDEDVLICRHGVRRLAVRGHILDPDDACERRRAHLDLVGPHDQQVHRVDQPHGEERDGGDRTGGDDVVRGKPATPQEDRRDGKPEGQIGCGKQHGSQPQGIALHAVTDSQRVVHALAPDSSEAEGVHGPCALDALGDRPVHHGVGFTFPLVTHRTAPEVPAGHRIEQRDPDQQGS